MLAVYQYKGRAILPVSPALYNTKYQAKALYLVQAAPVPMD
jgi:hypothetical protein